LKIEFVNQIQKERKSGKIKIERKEKKKRKRERSP
jgi:hypothetical protein